MAQPPVGFEPRTSIANLMQKLLVQHFLTPARKFNYFSLHCFLFICASIIIQRNFIFISFATESESDHSELLQQHHHHYHGTTLLLLRLILVSTEQLKRKADAHDGTSVGLS